MPSPASPDTTAAITLRGVTKEFGRGESRTRALRGVDLEIPYGELLMLVGPSGCGKTTLVSIMAGTLVTCSCSGAISRDDFLMMLSGVAQRSNRMLQLLECRGAAADHPVNMHCLEGEYLKCVIARVG